KAIKVTRPEVPILLLSSVGDDNPKKHKNLFTAILTKPIRQQELYNNVINEFKRFKKHTPQNELTQGAALLPADFADQFPLQILIAEDNPVNQKLTSIVLKKLGYDADVAEDGNQVLALTKQNSYDINLMDVQMPE